jgi:mannose-6-phosphate isomerase-like protein (cupin superfamily)
MRLPDRPGTGTPSYFFESLDFPVTDRLMEAYLAEFPAKAAASIPHQHDGAELVYVLSGGLGIRIGSEPVTLEASDAVYFDSSTPHDYRPEGPDRCIAIVVVSP